MSERQYTIGFANLDEDNPFAVRLREGLEAAAVRHGDVELVLRDNDLNSEIAAANIAEFVQHPVDLAMIFHIDEREGPKLVVPLTHAGIPVISVIHAIPLTTYFGVNNEQAGQMIGEDLAAWIHEHWNNEMDKVIALTNQRIVKSALQRISAALNALIANTSLSMDSVLYLDDGGLPETTSQRVHEILTGWGESHRIAIIALGDHIAISALQAARELGREEDIVIGGMDGIFVEEEEALKPASRLVYSLSFDTGLFGEQLLDLAIRILQGEQVPRQQLMPPTRFDRAKL
jgi:ABC-type sugar transport system substrate-binding protein